MKISYEDEDESTSKPTEEAEPTPEPKTINLDTLFERGQNNSDIFINVHGEFKYDTIQALTSPNMTLDSLSGLLNNEETFYSSNDLIFLLHSSFSPH
jgi:hypothetical protein